jgi:hypothetical protein
MYICMGHMKFEHTKSYEDWVWDKNRLTTTGRQCISCGNFSTFCQMKINVRTYTQKGEKLYGHIVWIVVFVHQFAHAVF